jgi:hypothetical protein
MEDRSDIESSYQGIRELEREEIVLKVLLDIRDVMVECRDLLKANSTRSGFPKSAPPPEVK